MSTSSLLCFIPFNYTTLSTLDLIGKYRELLSGYCQPCRFLLQWRIGSPLLRAMDLVYSTLYLIEFRAYTIAYSFLWQQTMSSFFLIIKLLHHMPNNFLHQPDAQRIFDQYTHTVPLFSHALFCSKSIFEGAHQPSNFTVPRSPNKIARVYLVQDVLTTLVHKIGSIVDCLQGILSLLKYCTQRSYILYWKSGIFSYKTWL